MRYPASHWKDAQNSSKPRRPYGAIAVPLTSGAFQKPNR